MTTNYQKFEAFLAGKYRDLFANDPDYAYSAAHTNPEALAGKMTASLARGSANKDGKAIKAACKEFNIGHTYRDIKAFLTV